MKTHKLSDLTPEELERLKVDKNAIDRTIINNWPLTDPVSFEHTIKFEGKYFRFDEVKQFLTNNGFVV